ncbi:hypothetical protein HJC23_011202 [Cyclotella cryptica]|uniref:Uncharacterized protein n=1 Tax=Cyclotella cryptica TaxID=29204 RepID=A0ABD3PWA1_9STRA|eukprot:CCRYP_010996-RA/>CCRYP_010996-RA protein AED:0.11 eAED:0.11 QI:0/-1/0/1/-1/1/1/0/227
MTSTCFWDDNIDWGDSSSTIHIVEPDEEPTHKLSVSSKNRAVESDRSPCASRSVMYDAHVGRAALGKRSSWLDWFENDDDHSNKPGSMQSNFPKQDTLWKENAKQRRKSTDDDASERCEKKASGTDSTFEQKLRSSTFFPIPFQMLVPLEHEGISAKQYKTVPRRRSTVAMSTENRPQLKKTLGGSLKQSTKDLTERVKKASSISEENVDEELDVPFPSRPRRRSVY